MSKQTEMYVEIWSPDWINIVTGLGIILVIIIGLYSATELNFINGIFVGTLSLMGLVYLFFGCIGKTVRKEVHVA